MLGAGERFVDFSHYNHLVHVLLMMGENLLIAKFETLNLEAGYREYGGRLEKFPVNVTKMQWFVVIREVCHR